MAIIFDTPEPTFRHKVYQQYKATRERMPEEMINSFPRLISALQTLQLPVLEKSGFEADDLMPHWPGVTSSKDIQVMIVSGDKDLAQLVTSDINIYVPAKSAQEPLQILDSKGVKEKYGVLPEQIRDWLALMGDKSDTFPAYPVSVKKLPGC